MHASAHRCVNPLKSLPLHPFEEIAVVHRQAAIWVHILSSLGVYFSDVFEVESSSPGSGLAVEAEQIHLQKGSLAMSLLTDRLLGQLSFRSQHCK